MIRLPSMRNLWPWLTLLLSAPVVADYSEHPRAQVLMQQLAAEEKFSATEIAAVRAALAQAERIPKLVEAEQKSAERTETWTTYAAKRVDAPRIELGADFIAEHRDVLTQAESEYGVPASIIAGVLGLETNFGRFTGSTRVLDALATQGFDHPTRAPFFYSELREFFIFCRDRGLDPTEPEGSYAGAMGWAQFMPSNYRRLAVDFDGDGKRDIWNSRADALGSIGNYLARSGWKDNETWGQEVSLPAGFDVNGAGRDNRKPVQEWLRLGVKPVAGAVRARGDAPAAVVLPDGPTMGAAGAAFLAYGNFGAIRRYNPSDFYAIAVGLIGDQIAA